MLDYTAGLKVDAVFLQDSIDPAPTIRRIGSR